MAFGIAFTIITVLHIVLGELAPKTIALQVASESTALRVTGPPGFSRVPPIHQSHERHGSAGRPALGFEPASEAQMIHSEEEIEMLVHASAQGGVLEPHEQDLIQRAFQFDRITAASVMLPRTEVVAVPSDISLPEMPWTAAVEARYTGYPVYEGEYIDNVVGVINVKRFVGMLAEILDVGRLEAFNVLDLPSCPCSSTRRRTRTPCSRR